MLYKYFWVTAIFISFAFSQAQIADKLVFAKKIGGPDSDLGNSIGVLSDNSFFVTGSFRQAATFGEEEPNQTTLNSNGSGDIFIAKYDVNGALVFVKKTGDTQNDFSSSIAVCSDDSFVITGSFGGTVTFGEEDPNETVLIANGSSDIFVAKYNQNGILIFAKKVAGTSTDSGNGIVVLSDNNFAITGLFSGTAIFGEGEPNQTVLTGSGFFDMFIAKYNQNGILVFAKKAGGTSDDRGLSITVLLDNNFVVTGSFRETAIFGEGEPNQTTLTSNGSSDMFIARYNSSGDLVFAKNTGGIGDIGKNNSVVVLSDNNFVVTGSFRETAIFGEGEPNQTTLISSGSDDIFIAKYNLEGVLIFAKKAGGTSNDRGLSIAVLLDNNVVVTGSFRETAIFGEGEPNQTTLTSNGSSDIFIAKYNSNGVLAFAKKAGGSRNDNVRSLAVFTNNSFLLTGIFERTITLGEGEPNQTILTSGSFDEIDIFIAKFTPFTGNEIIFNRESLAVDQEYKINLNFSTAQSTVRVVVNNGGDNSVLRLERTFPSGFSEPFVNRAGSIDVTYTNANTLSLTIRHDAVSTTTADSLSITISEMNPNEVSSVVVALPIGGQTATDANINNLTFTNFSPNSTKTSYPTGAVINEEVSSSENTFTLIVTDNTPSAIEFNANITFDFE